jgi:hypothetical protein
MAPPAECYPILVTLQKEKPTFLNKFYLSGGTGLSLQLGHRQSIDLDFFNKKDFDPTELQSQLEKFGDYVINNKTIMNKDIIWTDYALKEASKAGLEKWRVEKALAEPTRVERSTDYSECKNYVQVHNHVEIGVSAKKNKDNNWVIVSLWRRELL